MPMEEREALLALAENPDYLTNDFMYHLLKDIHENLNRLGFNGEIVRRIVTFAGMTAEMMGHLWKPILIKTQVDLSASLLQVAHHCELAMSDSNGLPFYTDAAPLVNCGRGLGSTTQSMVSDFVRTEATAYMNSALATKEDSLVSQLLIDAQLGTTNGLVFLMEAGRQSEVEVLGLLARCYTSNLRLMSSAIGMWILLESMQE